MGVAGSATYEPIIRTRPSNRERNLGWIVARAFFVLRCPFNPAGIVPPIALNFDPKAPGRSSTTVDGTKGWHLHGEKTARHEAEISCRAGAAPRQAYGLHRRVIRRGNTVAEGDRADQRGCPISAASGWLIWSVPVNRDWSLKVYHDGAVETLPVAPRPEPLM